MIQAASQPPEEEQRVIQTGKQIQRPPQFFGEKKGKKSKEPTYVIK